MPCWRSCPCWDPIPSLGIDIHRRHRRSLVEGDHPPPLVVCDLVNHMTPSMFLCNTLVYIKSIRKTGMPPLVIMSLLGSNTISWKRQNIEDIERVYPLVLCIHSFVQDLLSYNIGMSLRDTDAVGPPSKTLQKDFHRTNGRIPAAKRPPCPPCRTYVEMLKTLMHSSSRE